MTLATFPTGLRLNQIEFRLVDYVQASGRRGGGDLAIDYAAPRWTATWSTPSGGVRRADADAIQVLIDGLRGGVTRLAVWDFLRCRPRAHPTGFTGLTVAGSSAAFTGAATVSSLAVRAIGLGGLPAGFPLAAGDLVGLVEGDARSLHRVQAAVVASGGAVTVAVEPPVPVARYTAAATATLDAPSCVMRLVVGSASSRRDLDRTHLTFSMIEALG